MSMAMTMTIAKRWGSDGWSRGEGGGAEGGGVEHVLTVEDVLAEETERVLEGLEVGIEPSAVWEAIADGGRAWITAIADGSLEFADPEPASKPRRDPDGLSPTAF